MITSADVVSTGSAAAPIPHKFMWLLLIIALLINLGAYLLMGIDKSRAKHHKRRIPESVLLGFAVCLGSIGILLGMLMFHHKTNGKRHPAFVTGVPVILLVELIGALLLCTRLL